MDCDILGVTNINSKAQQAFESLSLLIALRLWLPLFPDHRTCIRVRGDNMAALSLLCKMQPKSPSLQIIAREIALDIAQCSFAPDFAEHVAGVSNTIADALSRRAEVGSDFVVPAALSSCEFHDAGSRTQEWWVTRRADDILG